MNNAKILTTELVLSIAYADVFGLSDTTSSLANLTPLGHWYGQKMGEAEIDYAIFDGRYNTEIDPNNDFFQAVTEDGSEGCWIRVELVHCDYKPDGCSGGIATQTSKRVGTIKTLNDGRQAWHDMGALAGEISYCANRLIWQVYKALKKGGDEQ